MQKLIHRALACLMLASLAACGGMQEIPFDHGANPGIKTIGLITVGMDPKPSIILASDMGQSFGLIGALVDAGMKANRDSKFATMMTAHNFDPKATFIKDLRGALTAQGYTLTDVPMAQRDNGLLKTYPKGGDGIDAYLDVGVPNYGYIASGIGDASPYRPFTYVVCRLVRASDSAVLMQDIVMYNPVTYAAAGSIKAVTISPDPSFTFVDFDTLMSDPNVTLKDFDAALAASANSVGNLVK